MKRSINKNLQNLMSIALCLALIMSLVPTVCISASAEGVAGYNGSVWSQVTVGLDSDIGDTNNDGVVDVNDYQVLVNTILADNHSQIGTASYDDIIRYDLDGDGTLDVIDAAIMHNLIIGFATVDAYAVGDFDRNGKAFEDADLKAIRHAIDNPLELSTAEKYACDINGNGKVDSADLTELTYLYGEMAETTCEDNAEVYYRWGYNYSTCTATAICVCNKKVATETTLNITSKTVLKATCTEDGKIKYTATFENGLFGTEINEVTIKAKGHVFNESGKCVCGAKKVETYYVYNAEDLYYVADLVNSGKSDINIILADNIVVNENVLNDGALNGDGSDLREWTPIGNYDYGYTGTFDGAGYTISGLYFNNNGTDYIGLIGDLEEDGVVKNVGVVDSCFNGNYYIGGVVGLNRGTMENCYYTGIANAYDYCGGVDGYNYGIIKSCHNTGIVNGNSYVGGIAGENNGSIENSYNTGNINGNRSIGGVVGYNNSNTATIKNSYNTGDIIARDNVGGVVGYNYGGNIEKCYNTGNVVGSDEFAYIGGLVGNNGDGTVYDCYNTGTVETTGSYGILGGLTGCNGGIVANCYSTANIIANGEYIGGGIVGYMVNGSMDNCYYNSTAFTGNSSGYEEGGSVNAAGKTTAEFATSRMADILNGNRTDSPWDYITGNFGPTLKVFNQ